MNTLRAHTKNVVNLLTKASMDKANADLSVFDLVSRTVEQYGDSLAFSAVTAEAEARAAAKASRVRAPKVYPKDAEGNEIRPKRGRPVGSKNKPKAPVLIPPDMVTSDPIPVAVSAEA